MPALDLNEWVFFPPYIGPPPSIKLSERLKHVMNTKGFTFIVVLLASSLILVITLTVRQQYSNSNSLHQTTKPPRPTPPMHKKSTNRPKLCQLPTKIPVYNKKGEVIGHNSEADRLKNASDIFLDKNGNLYVADTGNKRIIKYAKNNNNVTVIAQGTDGYSELNSPVALYVDEYETIFVLDNQNKIDPAVEPPYYRIFAYWPKLRNGQYVYESILLLNGSTGKGFGLDLDSESNIYIAMSTDPESQQFTYGSQGTGSIVKWLAPTYEFSTNVKGVATQGVLVNSNNGFTPKNIYIDHRNNIYFADISMFSLIRIQMSSYSIMKVSQNETRTLSFADAPTLMDIVIDCNDNMYIADGADNIIKYYLPTLGEFKKGVHLINITSAHNNTKHTGVTYLTLDSNNGDIYFVNLNTMGNTCRRYTILNNDDTDDQNPDSNTDLPDRDMNPKTDTYDPYILIWLDRIAKQESLDSLRTKNLLLQLNNNNCLFCDDPDVFSIEYSRLRNTNQKILLITSGSYAQQILQRSLGIGTMIIFCKNQRKYSHLSEHEAVRAICFNHDSLKNCIQFEIPSLRFNLFENRSLQSFRPLKSEQNSISTGAYFTYISFIDILKQMPKTEQAKAIMISKCLDYFCGRKGALEQVEEFRKTYHPDEAIKWYTKESFVYRLVNQAFRTEDVSLWYLFRFYIVDLSNQLEKVRAQQMISNKLTLYRGQGKLPVIEFEYLKSNLGGLIAMNGFLSTSGDLNIAKGFLASYEDTDNFKVALFIITVDAGNLLYSIFVDIDNFKGESYENEYLFDLGSVFRIDEVTHSDEYQAWLIRLTATDDNTNEIKEQLKIDRKNIQKENLNIFLGRLLLDMNYYAKAETYFQLMLQLLPKDHVDIPLVYDNLGDLNMRVTNWNEAYRNFSLALRLKRKLYRNTNDVFIAMSYNNLGNYYSAIEDFDTAYDYYEKALTCKIDLIQQAITKLNLGIILCRKNEYEDAFKRCFEAHLQLKEHYPNAHKEILHSYRILGNIYFQQNRLIEAESFYIATFDITKKYLVIGDTIQLSVIQSLIELYKKQNQQEKALNFCSEQLALYSQNLFSDHLNLAHLFVLQGQTLESNIEEQLHCYEKALKIYEKHIHFQYASTAACLILIGEYYQQKNMFERAVDYFTRANEIQKKIYPDDHPAWKKIEELITSLNHKY